MTSAFYHKQVIKAMGAYDVWKFGIMAAITVYQRKKKE